MRNVLTIAGKELRSYFHSPIAYVVMTVWAFFSGFQFYLLTAAYLKASFQMQMMGGMGAPSMSLNEYVIRPMLEGFLLVVLLFLVPAITMRLYAEEKRSGSIELLLTSPITDFQIIMGKFLGALGLFLALVILTFLYVGVLFIYGNPQAKPVLALALGMVLFGGALLAIGMWTSTFTRNQIIAYIIAFGVVLLLYIVVWVRDIFMSPTGSFMAGLSLLDHLENFTKGVIALGDVAYYVSVIFLGVFLTARSVDALKGRP